MVANGIGRLELVSGMMKTTKYIYKLEKNVPRARSLFSDVYGIFKMKMHHATVLKQRTTDTEPIKLKEWISLPIFQI